MAEKAKLIDTTLCQGCKACQVACKQWNHLAPVTAADGLNRGSYANPPDRNHHTWSVVRFNEVAQDDGSLRWVFWQDACRHCPEPFCQALCTLRDSETGAPLAIVRDAETGAVVYHSELCGDCRQQCITGCPYDIPRFLTGVDADGHPVEYRRAFKCRLCVDRLKNTDRVDGTALGLSPAEQVPACAKACPSGAIQFGDKPDIVAKARQRLAELLPRYPRASIYPAEGYGAMWIVTEKWEDLGLLPVRRTASLRDARRPLDKRGLFKSIGSLALTAMAGVWALGGLDRSSDEKAKKA